MGDRLPNLIAVAITVVWVASITLDAFVGSYDPPPSIHALMMIVAGWAFGQRYLKKNGANDGR